MDTVAPRHRDRTAGLTFEYGSSGGGPTRRGALRFDWVQYVKAERTDPPANAAPAEPLQVFERLDSDLRRRVSTHSPATARHFDLRTRADVFDVVAATIELAVESSSNQR